MKRTDFYLRPRSRHGISHAAALCGCLLLLAACGADGGAPDMPQAGLPIGFSTDVEGRQTRSGELTAANLLSTGIFAYYTGSNDWTAADTPNFMYNQEVKRTDASSPWTYSPVKYWPNNPADKISFFAYAPYNAAGVTPCGNTVAGFPYLDYTVPTAEANQTDLLAATPLMNQSYANTPVTPSDPTTQGKISFNMQHALTKVSIYAKSSDPGAGKVVNSLSITAPKSGRLTYKADGFGWNPSADKSTYTATATNVTIAPTTADGTVLLGTFYLISDRANSSLNITYTLTGSISGNVNPPTDNIVITAKAFPDTYDWTPGTSINYTVNIARTGLEIVAESSSMEWTNGATNEIELYAPTQLKLGDYYYSDGSWSDGGLTGMDKTTNTRIWKSPLPDPDLSTGKECIGIVVATKNDEIMNLRTNAGDSYTNGLVTSIKDWGGGGTFAFDGLQGGWSNPEHQYTAAPSPTSGWYISNSAELNWLCTYKEIFNNHISKVNGGTIFQDGYWYKPYEMSGANGHFWNFTTNRKDSKNWLSKLPLRGLLAF